jgi:uncharacterized protein
MLNKTIGAIALALILPIAAAQNAPSPSSPAKKELVARILKAQQPGIEAMARSMVEQPAMELLGSAGNALPNRVPKERQEAVAKEIQADVQKYLADTVPMVQARAVKLAPTTIGPLLEERFTEGELKQVLALLESPVFAKYQRMGEEMQRSLAGKLIPEMRPTVEPRVRALEETVGKRLGVTAPPAANAAPGAAPKAAAPKPAKPASN